MWSLRIDMERSLLTLGLVILILIAPYWIYLPAIFIAAVYMRFYWQAVPLGFLIDVFYGIHPLDGSVFGFPFAIALSFLVIIFIPLREKLRFNAA